ncbi:uncharacterized protein EKO05_0009336 [Ascochyta rabiei]|uniref:uncharacterized protein n=1 Tax=Didymella rabiei TaxID=5454 RepID=UPI00190190AD|nr:uncharacterized protein EKO05_0009336 [Ascochyta rabiei]UPX19060.1 hypothetical protein EKO05_0009336 [Ascochyta rabiei]
MVSVGQRVSNRRSKRPVINEDNEFDETDVKRETDVKHIHKRGRHTYSPATVTPDPTNPTSFKQPSNQVQSTLESLAKQCKAEADQEHTSQIEMSRTEIAQLQVEISHLQAELAGQKQKNIDVDKEVEDQKKRAEEQNTEIFTLEGEVAQEKEKNKELKEKYEDVMKKYERLNKELKEKYEDLMKKYKRLNKGVQDLLDSD